MPLPTIRVWTLVLLCAGLPAAPAAAQSPSPSPSPFTFTIYTEEGNPNGHVFIGISDGTHDARWGWYTAGKTAPQKMLGLIACGGGELRHDDDTEYAASKTWTISEDGYREVIAHIIRRQGNGAAGVSSWSPFNHCGDFALDAADAAGVKLNLPVHWYGYDRPGVFEDYLLAHGGSKHYTHGGIDTNGIWTFTWEWSVTAVTFEGHVTGTESGFSYEGTIVSGGNAVWTAKRGSGHVSCSLTGASEKPGALPAKMSCSATTDSDAWKGETSGTYETFSAGHGKRKFSYRGRGSGSGKDGKKAGIDEFALDPKT